MSLDVFISIKGVWGVSKGKDTTNNLLTAALSQFFLAYHLFIQIICLLLYSDSHIIIIYK